MGIPGTGVGWEQSLGAGASQGPAAPPVERRNATPSAGCLSWFLVFSAGVAFVQITLIALDAPGLAPLGVFGGLAALVVWKVHRDKRRAAALEAEQAAIERRYQALSSRFGDEAAESIMNGQIWVGATADMVIEALGPPADTDERVLKTKTKHVYKYWPTGPNRYAYRVTLEDGVVVGWDDKR